MEGYFRYWGKAELDGGGFFNCRSGVGSEPVSALVGTMK